MGTKRIPHFESDDQAAEFWDTHDFTEYAEDTVPAPDVVFPKPHLKQISLRLSPAQISRLKQVAAGKGVGYQTMLRMWIAERLHQERAA
jgi:predicted DNA binding CopG/RHH family protein